MESTTRIIEKSPYYVNPIINYEDPIVILADIEYPEGPPYEPGIFLVRIFISKFPQIAPKNIFLANIFHPNVSEKGKYVLIH